MERLHAELHSQRQLMPGAASPVAAAAQPALLHADAQAALRD